VRRALSLGGARDERDLAGDAALRIQDAFPLVIEFPFMSG
jgi:hypothetical protein